MKIQLPTMLLALMGMLLCGNAQASDQMRYSGLEQRLAALEAQVAAQQGVHSASYNHEEGADASASACGCSDCNNGLCFQPSCCGNDGGAYATFEFLWMRPHVSEDWIGKLSESHHLSTRTVLGYENCCGVGARARYWEFDHDIRVLDPGTLGMNVEVLDLEVTNRLSFRSTDLLLGGGFRYAYWKLTDSDGAPVAIDAYGLTLAADGRTPLCTYCNNRWSFVYGARWSLLGGDWRGDNDIINTIFQDQVRDDNLVVTELYAGVEYLFCYCGYNLFARSLVEMQNWESDVLSEPGIGTSQGPGLVGSTDSIGFVGIGLQLGVGF